MEAKVSNDKKRRTVISYAGVAAILLAVALLYGLWDKSEGKTTSEAAQTAVSESDYYVQTISDTDVNMDDVDIERVKVTELLQIVESDGDWGGESMVQRTQLFTVDILTGSYKGESAVMTLDLTDITGTGKGVIEAKVGDRLLGYFVTDESTGALVGTCTGFQRDLPLLWLGIGLILLMLLFFGREGFKSFAALAVTCVILIFVMIPLVYHGMDPILAVAVCHDCGDAADGIRTVCLFPVGWLRRDRRCTHSGADCLWHEEHDLDHRNGGRGFHQPALHRQRQQARRFRHYVCRYRYRQSGRHD